MPKWLQNIIANYAAVLGRYYVAFWLALVLIIGVAVLGLYRLELSVNTNKFFLQRDQNAQANREFKEKYHIGENVGIYVEGGNLLQPELLDRLSMLSKELGQLPFVRSVQSLTDIWQRSRGESQAARLQNFANFVAKHPEIEALRADDWRSMWVLLELYPYEEYIASLKDSEGDIINSAELQQMLEDVVRNSSQNLRGVKGQGLQLLLPQSVPEQYQSTQQLRTAFEDKKIPGDVFSEFLSNLLQNYERESEPLKFISVGLPVNSFGLEKELSADLIRVLSVAAFICLLCILLLMQSFAAALGTLLCVVANALIVFGFSGWLGLSVDKTFVMIPVLLGFASSISYCVHIEKDWEKLNGLKHHKLRKALLKNVTPLSFAALTTVLSLLSFLSVPIPMIRTAGVQSALAVALSYILALTLFPSILRLQKRNRPKENGKNFLLYRLQRASYMVRFSMFCYRHSRTTICIAGFFALASLYLLPRLSVDLSTESLLGQRFEYVRNLLRVSRSEIGAGGFYSIDLQFPSDPLQHDYLVQVERFGLALQQRSKLVKSVSSLPSFLQSVQSIYGKGSELPETAREIRQGILAWERLFSMDRSSWYSGQSLRMLVQVGQGSSAEKIAHMEEVRQLGRQIFDPDVKVVPLGGVFQLAIMNQYITRGLLNSLGLSLFCVAILMLLLLRSWRFGLIALVPNLFPILFTGAIVVLLQRHLEFISMTVGPMIIGLAVDDTIYFLGYTQNLMKKKPARKLHEIVQQTLSDIAPALITTTLILCALFASLLLSKADNIRYMGIYTIIAMGAALLSCLLFTPILLRWSSKKCE